MQTDSRSPATIKFIEVIGLQTPRGRLLFFALFPALFLLVTSTWPESWPPLSVYALLGIPSPSIGLTRAFMQLIQGNITAAWQQNWLIFPAVAAVTGIIVRDVSSLTKNNRGDS